MPLYMPRYHIQGTIRAQRVVQVESFVIICMFCAHREGNGTYHSFVFQCRLNAVDDPIEPPFTPFGLNAHFYCVKRMADDHEAGA